MTDTTDPAKVLLEWHSWSYEMSSNQVLAWAERAAHALEAQQARINAAVAELESLIDLNEGTVAWTENNFLPGPNGAAAIRECNYANEQLREVSGALSGGVSDTEQPNQQIRTTEES